MELIESKNNKPGLKLFKPEDTNKLIKDLKEYKPFDPSTDNIIIIDSFPLKNLNQDDNLKETIDKLDSWINMVKETYAFNIKLK